MHAVEILFSKCSVQIQIVSNTVKMHALIIYIIFKMFPAVPNRFKYRQDACMRPSLFSNTSLKLQIVSNKVRMYALSCFQNYVCSSKISIHFLNICLTFISFMEWDGPLSHAPHQFLE